MDALRQNHWLLRIIDATLQMRADLGTTAPRICSFTTPGVSESKMRILLTFLMAALASLAHAETLRVFTWDGYVLPDEVKAVNALLADQGYDVKIKVIDTWAEGPEQMFTVMRSGAADVSFLTLNYIQMGGGKLAKILQPIDTGSPRLTRYSKLLPSLTAIPMGLDKGKPLYVPWGGGAYGLWADMDKLSPDQLPKSVGELWEPKWKGKLSLTKGQIQPNVALAMLAMGKPPFHLNDIASDRAALATAAAPNGEIQQKMDALYSQVGHFWGGGPEFHAGLEIMASYGPGVAARNAEGGNWELINFSEGNTVWLDTINFHKDLSGKKLEAAEVFLNYFIGPEVQGRVVQGLGMVAASSEVENPLLKQNPDFFSERMFWPPYDAKAANLMTQISDRAMKK